MAFLLTSFWGDILLVLFLLGCALYGWFQKKFRYWSSRGVYGPAPMFPFGNLMGMLKGKHIGNLFAEFYFENKKYPYVGIYMLHRNAMVINNLEMIKNITVKDFNHFTDHGLTFNVDHEPLAAHLFNVNGSKWRRIRHKLSPAFTSSKMKYMYETIAACGEEMKDFLLTAAKAGEIVDMKDVVSNYSADVISSCAFGIDSNSFKCPDTLMRTIGQSVFDVNIKQAILMFLPLFAPQLLQYVDLKMLDKNITKFFTEAVEKTVKYRKENNVQRNDLMQLMIRLMNNQSIEDHNMHDDTKHPEDGSEDPLTISEVAAQAFGFLLGGFETSSTITSFALHELAKRRDIQRLVRLEIDAVLDKYSGKVTYEALKEMHYLTQVIEETLRLYPSLPILLRKCTQDYRIPGTDVVIEKETPVIIPILGIHMDPEIYSDPEVFDPTRFDLGSKQTRHASSYLPFGDGPRICIGKRFGAMLIRVALVSILRNYEVTCAEDKPVELNNKVFFISPKAGIRMKIQLRT